MELPEWANNLTDDIRIQGRTIKGMKWNVGDLANQVLRCCERQNAIELSNQEISQKQDEILMKLDVVLCHLGIQAPTQTNTQKIMKQREEADFEVKDILAELQVDCSMPGEHAHLFGGACCGTQHTGAPTVDDKAEDEADAGGDDKSKADDKHDDVQADANNDSKSKAEPQGARVDDNTEVEQTDAKMDDKYPNPELQPSTAHLGDDADPSAASVGRGNDDEEPRDIPADVGVCGDATVALDREDSGGSDSGESDSDDVVQPNQAGVALRRSTRHTKPSDLITSPYTAEKEKKKLPRRPKNCFFTNAERTPFYDWYNDEKYAPYLCVICFVVVISFYIHRSCHLNLPTFVNVGLYTGLDVKYHV